MTIELIIAVLIFFGAATSEQINKLDDQEVKSYYEEQELDDASFIDEWLDGGF